MNIQDYANQIRTKSKGKVKAPIIERWNTRVVPRGLDSLGRDGANAYLDAYGKGIAAPKVAELAICAEAMGAAEMAAGFWEASFTLSTGARESFGGGTSAPRATVSAPKRGTAGGAPTLSGLPDGIQPGRVATMQPVDADHPQSHYILNGDYLGQPKRDGCRNVLFATADGTFHQSRSTSDLGQISPDFEKAAKLAAGEIGPFVLDGERYYRSATGSEHRTAAQAAAVNIASGHPKARPVAVFAAFEALFAAGRDLRSETKEERIAAAAGPVARIASHLPKNGAKIEAVPTARTAEEKRLMAEKQKAEGREGEVWTDRSARYEGGKKHGATVRTKYTQEGEFTVVGIKYTSTKTRSVGSFEVADENGISVGYVGSGFDAATGNALAKAHEKRPGSVRLKVRYQGVTEGSKLWHPRMLEVV